MEYLWLYYRDCEDDTPSEQDCRASHKKYKVNTCQQSKSFKGSTKIFSVQLLIWLTPQKSFVKAMVRHTCCKERPKRFAREVPV